MTTATATVQNASASVVVFDRIGAAFKLLRSAGFVARQNFQCCGGCASCAIAEDVGEKGKWVSGAVFTTRQDCDAESCRAIDRNPARQVFIKYGPVNVSGTAHPGTYGYDTVTCGRAVAEACEAVGLEVEWNGSGAMCIAVRLPEAERVEARTRYRYW